MRLIGLNTVVFFLLLCSCDTPSNVEPTYEQYFTKYYGGDGEQEGVDIVRNDDGSMILLGNSFSQTNPISPFIVKTDPMGNVLWQREFQNNNEIAVDVELVNGGSQLAVLSNVQRGTTNICIYILGQDGNLVDSLYITKPTNQSAKSISQASDNGFLITGSKDPDPARNPYLPPPDLADILLLKVDNALDVVTDLSPGGGEHVGAGVKSFEVSFNSDIYYLVFGYSDRPREEGSAEYQMCFQLIAANTSGTPTGLHGVSSGENGEEQVASTAIKIPPALGDGYLMIGTTSSGSSSDLYITRFSKPSSPNEATSSLDRKIPLGKQLEGISAANASPDGYFVIANEVRENSKKDIFLMRIERDGTVSWTTSFGSLDGEDTAGGVEALPDGRIAVVGTIQLETQKKIALIITNPNGGFSD
jgi:hypothetical protein